MVIYLSKDLNKSVHIGFKTTQEISERIENFHKQKSKDLGVKISKNQAIEFLIVLGLNINEKT